MDRTDKEILYELDLNARQPFSHISKKVRLTKEAVKYRVDALKRKGIISGTTIFSNLPKLGYLYVKVYLQLRGANERKEEEIRDYLLKAQSVVWMVECVGKYDVIINCVFKTIHDFDSWMEGFLAKYSKYVERHDTSFLTDIERLPRHYLSQKPVLTKAQEIAYTKLDGIDMQILSMLSRDARINSHAIGLKTRLTGAAVRKRIRKLLEKGYINRFTVNLGYGAFERTLVKVMFNFQSAEAKRRKAFRDYCRNLPGLLYMTLGTGVSDLDLDFEVENLKDLQKILKEIKFEFYDLVREYELVVISSERKLDLSSGILSLT